MPVYDNDVLDFIKGDSSMKRVRKAFLIIVLILLLLGGVYGAAKVIGIKGQPSIAAWNESAPFDPAEAERLVKKDGEDFTILLFSDIQIGANPFRDAKALKMMDALVEETDPDFIMTAGDNTYLLFSGLMTKTIVKKMEGYGIPWAVTLGNHDSEGIADRNWVGNQYESAENSLFEMGPADVQGVGNYVINIADESGEDMYSLIMMDSNVNRRYEGGRDYDYIHPGQIDWYEWVVSGQGDVPSMLFFHIPLPEFADVKEMWEAGELDPAAAFGENRERVCCPPVNTGLFDKVLALGRTTHIFVGHDHVNCLSADYKGVRLTYGLKTGPACYADSDMQGATLITIEDGTNAVRVEHIYINESVAAR